MKLYSLLCKKRDFLPRELGTIKSAGSVQSSNANKVPFGGHKREGAKGREGKERIREPDFYTFCTISSLFPP